jgi:biopolymer transport protein ExbD
MRLDPPQGRSRRHLADLDMVPMINVVFLLLIFFLTSATLRAKAPVELTLPVSPLAEASDPARDAVLYIAADGLWHYGAEQGRAAVLAELQSALLQGAETEFTLKLALDATLPAQDLARALVDFAAIGVGRVDLITRAGGAP